MAATYNEAGYAYNEPITYEGGTGTPPDPEPEQQAGGGRKPRRLPPWRDPWAPARDDDELLLLLR